MEYFDDNLIRKVPTNRAAYSDRMAYIMASMSELAYLKHEDGERGRLVDSLESGGFSLKATLNNNESQAFMACCKDYAVLSFRGTEGNIKDILSDLKFRLKDGKHRGFAQAYENVAEEVREYVLGKPYQGYCPLYITGHSLGAAIAVIATQDLDGVNLAACYTFGCPRVGNAEFDRSVKAPVYRVVNAADGVARVPFFVMGRIHVGDLRYLTRKGDLLRNPNTIRRFGRFTANFLRRPKSTGTDHAIKNYRKKLKNIALKRNKP
jgi:hypothetical protein